MCGILYGIGTGPGDPELMTIKAVRTIQSCDVIAIPVSSALNEPKFCPAGQQGAWEMQLKKACVAYRIAVENVPELDKKDMYYAPMPMIRDAQKLKKIHDAVAEKLIALLKEGHKIGFLTIGDPTVYSTYLYLHRRVLAQGLQAQIINGVPSFCAAAARLNTGLVENRQQLHVIPASYDVEEAMALEGTKVFMKAGKRMPQLKSAVQKQEQKLKMVENCGLPDEHIYLSPEQMPEQSSYYSIVIMQEEK